MIIYFEYQYMYKYDILTFNCLLNAYQSGKFSLAYFQVKLSPF